MFYLTKNHFTERAVSKKQHKVNVYFGGLSEHSHRSKGLGIPLWGESYFVLFQRGIKVRVFE
ncbi:hypothetical protein MNBD_GAMMA16-2012 [hydrothermal vent metagenome]|uniref:Uncharacterized protein n=1 Tax=hydrothermal vent metagenome TaxID=652676 RepID=A0A3B0Z6X6_9ZZZZ